MFQGRYQALPIETAAALAAVVDYIHLNPFRARLVEVYQLAGFRWCSLRAFLKGSRHKGLVGDLVMGYWGLQDGGKGWATYWERLQGLATDEEEQRRLGFAEMCKGWAIGTEGWKRARP